jgi:antitoxin HicB
MEKNIDYYLGLPYTRELIPEDSGIWFVRIKELPNCMSQGNTAEEALLNIKDAMYGWIQGELEDGESIPEPREEEEYSGQFRTRIPKSLHRKLVETADLEGVSMNSYISTLLAEALGGAGAKTAQQKSMASKNSYISTLESICLAAGLKNLEDKDPEVEFSNWFYHKMNQIISYMAGDKTKAFEHLAYMILMLRPLCEDSPALFCLVNLLGWTKESLQQSIIKTPKPTQRKSEGLKNIINVTNKMMQEESLRANSPAVAEFANIARIGFNKGSVK